MTEQGWKQRVEKRNRADAKGLDETCACLSGRQGARGEQSTDGIMRKESKNAHSETCKMPKTNFLDFLIWAQGWAPGTRLSFLINHSWMHRRPVFKSQWAVEVCWFRFYLYYQIRSFPLENGTWTLEEKSLYLISIEDTGGRRILFLKTYKDYWVFKSNNANLLKWPKRNPHIHNQPLKLLRFLGFFVRASEKLCIPKPLEM